MALLFPIRCYILGMYPFFEEYIMSREQTKVVHIGDRVIGGGNPVLIQSMTNTKTEDVSATVSQISRLAAASVTAVPTQFFRTLFSFMSLSFQRSIL